MNKDNILIGIMAFFAGLMVAGLYCFYAAFDMVVDMQEFHHNGDFYITMKYDDYKLMKSTLYETSIRQEKELLNLKIKEWKQQQYDQEFSEAY